MRTLTFIVFILAAIYSGYWFVGANAVEKAANDGIAQLRINDWTVDYASLETKGFPSRFDTTMQDPDISSPDGRVAWRAAFLETYALSYQPNQFIVALPTEQRLVIDGQELSIKSQTMRASAAIKPETELGLDEATIEIEEAVIAFTPDLTASFARLLAALRSKAESPLAYDSYLAVTEILMPQRIQRAIDPSGQRPATLDQVVFDGVVTFDQPLDRDVVGRVLVDAIDVKRANFTWGDMSASVKGVVLIGADGYPTGTLALDLVDWDGMISIATNLGLLDPEITPTIRNLAQALSAGQQELSLSVTFADGRTRIGPFPVGPAPRLR